MTKPVVQLPDDPSQLHLHYAFQHDLHLDPHDQTVERWEISVRHGYEVHDDRACPALKEGENADGYCEGFCPAYEENGIEIGQMLFYRIRLSQGMNAWWAMEEESQELYELGSVLIDQETGNLTDDLDEQLELFGTDLLVMDQVVLGKPWRGFGLGPILAAEAINRLFAGVRVIACTPGISERDDELTHDEAEWDRVTALITAGWKRVGFELYQDNVHLIDPATEVLDNQLTALRAEFKQLCAAWTQATKNSV